MDGDDFLSDGEPTFALQRNFTYRWSKKPAKGNVAAIAAVAGFLFAAGCRSETPDREKTQKLRERTSAVLAQLNEAYELFAEGGATAEKIHGAAREVVEEVGRLLAELPNESDLHLIRGKALRLLVEDEAAERDFLEAVRLDESSGPAHYELGMMYLGRVIDARIALTEEERTQQEAQAKNEWYPKARERFEKAEAAAHPVLREKALTELWRKYLDGKGEEARQESDRLIKRTGRVEAFHHLRGVILCGSGNLEAALADLTEAVKRAPTNPQYRFDRGFLRGVLKDYDGAIEDYTEALKINPRFAIAYVNRALTKGILHDFKGEIEDCTEALKINPRNATAYANRGSAKGELGNLKGEIEDCTQALKINPLFAGAYVNRGAAKYVLRDFNGAFEDATEALKINPRLPEAFNNRSNAKYSLGDFEGAIDDATQALKINPRFANAYDSRGIAKGRLGDLKGAIDDFSEALKINSRLASAYAMRGIMREAMATEEPERTREHLAAAAADLQAALDCPPAIREHRDFAESALRRVREALRKLDREY